MSLILFWIKTVVGVLLFLAAFGMALRLNTQSKKSGRKLNLFSARSLLFLCWSGALLMVFLPSSIILTPLFLITWNVFVWTCYITCICIAVLRQLDTLQSKGNSEDSRKPAFWILIQAFLFMLFLGLFLLSQYPQLLPDRITENLEELQGRLGSEIVDEESQLSEAHDHHSKYQYSVYAQKSDWQVWTQVYVFLPEAEIGLSYGEIAKFAIVPVYLEEGVVPNVEVFTHAMMKSAKINSRAAWQGKWQRQQQNGYEGFVFNFEDRIQEASMTYKMKIMKGEHFGYMISAWGETEKLKAKPDLLQSIHDRVVLKNLPKEFDPPSDFSPIEKIRHGNLYSNLGVSMMRSKNFKDSLDYFKKAHDFLPDNKIILGRVLLAFMKLNDYRGARNYLETELKNNPQADYLYEALDDVIKEQGSVDQVFTEWQDAFSASDITDEDEDYSAGGASSATGSGGSKKTSKQEKKEGLSIHNRLEETSLFDYQESADLLQEKDVIAEKRQGSSVVSNERAAAFYESINHTIDFQEGVQLTKTDHRILKVLDTRRATQYKTLHFVFDPDKETIRIDNLTVRNQQNQIVHEGVPTDTSIMSAEFLKGEAFKGKKILELTIPEFQNADVIDVKLKREAIRPTKKLPFIRYTFDSKLPVKTHQLALRANNLDQITFQVKGDVKEVVGGQEITWTYKDTSIGRGDVLSSARRSQIPMVWAGNSEDSWQSAGSKYLSQIEGRLIPNQETSMIAKNLTNGITTTAGKIESLFRYLQSDILFKRKTVIPDLENQTFKEQKDSFTEGVFFLMRLLKSLGLQPQPALVKSSGAVQKEIPSIDQFDKMLVYLESENLEIFIDATYPSDSYQNLSSNIKGRAAFLLSSDQPDFKKVKQTIRGN